MSLSQWSELLTVSLEQDEHYQWELAIPVQADYFARYMPGVGWVFPCKGLLYVPYREEQQTIAQLTREARGLMAK